MGRYGTVGARRGKKKHEMFSNNNIIWLGLCNDYSTTAAADIVPICNIFVIIARATVSSRRARCIGIL